MVTPPLATVAATSAICRGEACTSFWPIADWARAGVLSVKSVGKFDATGSGRSNGGASLKPKDSAPSIVRSAPSVSTAMRAKEVLHDSVRIGIRVPPQVWELANARVVWGGV
jgi:hypothetical protein